MSETPYQTFTGSPIGTSTHAIRITFSNPPINLITTTFLSEIVHFLSSIPSLPDPPKVIVFSSSNPDFWLSHLDLHIISGKYPLPPNEDSPTALHNLGKALELLRTLPTISIAEVNGRAVGGGNEFAINMDMRFAGPNARFGMPEVAGGVIHGGGLQKLVQVIGPAHALEWNLSARAILAKEAEKIGWVNRAFEMPEALRKHTDALAERIAKFPRMGMEATKASVEEAVAGIGDVGNDMKRLGELAHTEEAQKLIARLIEEGEDQKRGSFELGLPDTAADL